LPRKSRAPEKQGRASFSEEKEAKRLLFGQGARWRPAARIKRITVIWFFLSKENNACLPFDRPAVAWR
jgi:hypothetical protein